MFGDDSDDDNGDMKGGESKAASVICEKTVARPRLRLVREASLLDAKSQLQKASSRMMKDYNRARMEVLYGLDDKGRPRGQEGGAGSAKINARLVIIISRIFLPRNHQSTLFIFFGQSAILVIIFLLCFTGLMGVCTVWL